MAENYRQKRKAESGNPSPDLKPDRKAIRTLTPFNPISEVEKRKRANDRSGARRLRRFTSRPV
jgi:hypothetical protein